MGAGRPAAVHQSRLHWVVQTAERLRTDPTAQRIVRRSTVGALLFTFVASSLHRISVLIPAGYGAIDLRIYRAAAIAALDGRNPWSASVDGIVFAAPPPTLLLYLPAAALPEASAVTLYTTISVVAVLFVVRRLRLPLWWIAFPPFVEGFVVLNPDLIVIALLLLPAPVAGLAVVAKIYGGVPLLLQRRWAALLTGVVVGLLSVPWWPNFFGSLPDIVANLARQSGSLSAWGTWLAVPTTVALWLLRRRGASWLVVPALWPSTQLHYSAMALPAAARSPLLAFLLSFGVVLLPPIAVIAEAAWRTATAGWDTRIPDRTKP